MGKETLTHEEIASLLPSESTGTQHGDSHQAGDFDPPRASARQAVDLVHSPDSLPVGDQSAICRLRTISGDLARAGSAALSEFLRATADAGLLRVDRLTYGEFVLYRNDPTCFMSLHSDIAPGPFAIDIELSILFPMIELMLGGDLQGAAPRSRPLTDIEKCLATRIAERLLHELQSAWQPMGAFGLTVAGVGSEPRKTESLLSRDAIACIQFQVVIGSNRGTICLALPWRVAEGLSVFKEDEGDRGQTCADGPPSEEVELSAVLAQTKMAAVRIQNLKVGDIITTESEIGDPLEVTIAGDARFRASPGVLNGHKAIRIE